jgi:hypothetical protein
MQDLVLKNPAAEVYHASVGVIVVVENHRCGSKEGVESVRGKQVTQLELVKGFKCIGSQCIDIKTIPKFLKSPFPLVKIADVGLMHAFEARQVRERATSMAQLCEASIPDPTKET